MGCGEQRVEKLHLGFVSAFASIHGARQLAALADQAANIRTQLSLASRSAQEFATAQAEVYAIAQRTSTAMASTAELYARITRSVAEYGVTQERVLRLTETINQTFAVSGTAAAAQANAITQLTQAFAGGVLRAEEFNSVIENSPRLAQALADGLGLSIGQLRQQVNAGAVDVQAMLGALESQAEAIEREFSRMPLTIERAWTQLSNAFVQFIGNADQASGASRAIAGAMATVAEHAGAVITTVAALATAYLLRLVPALAAGAAGWLSNTLQVLAYQAALMRMAATAPAVAGALGMISKGLAALSAVAPMLLAVTAAAGGIYMALGAVDRAVRENEAAWSGHIDSLREAADAAADVRARLDDVAASAPLPTDVITAHTEALQALNRAEAERAQLLMAVDNAQARVAASEAGLFDSAGAFLTKITGSTIGTARALEHHTQRLGEHDAEVNRLRESLGALAPAFERAFGQATQGVMDEFSAALGRIRTDSISSAFADLTAAVSAGAKAMSDRVKEMDASASALNDIKSRIAGAAADAQRKMEDMAASGARNLGALAQKALDMAQAQGASQAELDALKASFDASIASVSAYEKAQERARKSTQSASSAAREQQREQERLAEQGARYVESLREQVAAYGLTGEARERAKLATPELTEAQRAEAEGLLDLIAHWRDLEDAMEPAHRAMEELSRGHADLDERIARNADALAGLSRHQVDYNAAVRAHNKMAAEAAMLGPVTAEQYAALEDRLQRLGEILAQEIALDEMAEAANAAAQEAQELESILRRFDDIGFGGLMRDMERVKVALAEATDPAQIERLQQRALGELRHGLAAGVVATAQDGLRSLQTMASEGSDAFRAMQAAIDALTVVQAISAILNQGNGDPYTAFARMAAMAAAVAQFVGSVGSFQSSFSDTAAQRGNLPSRQPPHLPTHTPRAGSHGNDYA